MRKILALCAGLAWLGISSLASDLESVKKAPELVFTVPGEGQKTLSQYQGKVVALEFIYTTCPHCQAASRIMTKLQSEYGSRGLQVIDVAVNPNADLLVENFAKDYQVNFPIAWTTDAAMTSFMGFDPGRYVVPQLVLIDRKGYIHYKTPAKESDAWDKLMKEENIRQHIERLLSTSTSAKGSDTRVARAAFARKGS